MKNKITESIGTLALVIPLMQTEYAACMMPKSVPFEQSCSGMTDSQRNVWTLALNIVLDGHKVKLGTSGDCQPKKGKKCAEGKRKILFIESLKALLEKTTAGTNRETFAKDFGEIFCQDSHGRFLDLRSPLKTKSSSMRILRDLFPMYERRPGATYGDISSSLAGILFDIKMRQLSGAQTSCDSSAQLSREISDVATSTVSGGAAVPAAPPLPVASSALPAGVPADSALSYSFIAVDDAVWRAAMRVVLGGRKVVYDRTAYEGSEIQPGERCKPNKHKIVFIRGLRDLCVPEKMLDEKHFCDAFFDLFVKDSTGEYSYPAHSKFDERTAHGRATAPNRIVESLFPMYHPADEATYKQVSDDIAKTLFRLKIHANHQSAPEPESEIPALGLPPEESVAAPLELSNEDINRANIQAKFRELESMYGVGTISQSAFENYASRLTLSPHFRDRVMDLSSLGAAEPIATNRVRCLQAHVQSLFDDFKVCNLSTIQAKQNQMLMLLSRVYHHAHEISGSDFREVCCILMDYFKGNFGCDEEATLRLKDQVVAEVKSFDPTSTSAYDTNNWWIRFLRFFGVQSAKDTYANGAYDCILQDGNRVAVAKSLAVNLGKRIGLQSLS